MHTLFVLLQRHGEGSGEASSLGKKGERPVPVDSVHHSLPPQQEVWSLASDGQPSASTINTLIATCFSSYHSAQIRVKGKPKQGLLNRSKY
jgi:hypothetical protein